MFGCLSLFDKKPAGSSQVMAIIKIGTSINTNIITKLIGLETYQVSETQIEYLVISMDAKEIILDNL
jgi:hypothetical protein